MRHRLGRLDRIYTEQVFFFITLATQGRKAILADAALHTAFSTFCRNAETHGIFVGRYVIMPDHIHLFAAFREHDQISGWIKSLKNYLSKTLNSLGTTAPHWQKGFFDHLMRDADSYAAKWEYVWHNPVRHNLVLNASAWLFQGEIVPLSFE